MVDGHVGPRTTFAKDDFVTAEASVATIQASPAAAAKSADQEPVRAKFQHPDWTAKGERRAVVPLDRLDSLWINTGTLCNITCQNCYIESSPKNDRLAYITRAEVAGLPR